MTGSSDDAIADQAEPITAAHAALDGLRSVGALLGSLVVENYDAAADPELQHRSERSISMGIAMLAPTRAEAAVALEASVAGAQTRTGATLARDLQHTVDLLTNALTHALDQ